MDNIVFLEKIQKQTARAARLQKQLDMGYRKIKEKGLDDSIIKIYVNSSAIEFSSPEDIEELMQLLSVLIRKRVNRDLMEAAASIDNDWVGQSAEDNE
jgi:hypothetical protein